MKLRLVLLVVVLAGCVDPGPPTMEAAWPELSHDPVRAAKAIPIAAWSGGDQAWLAELAGAVGPLNGTAIVWGAMASVYVDHPHLAAAAADLIAEMEDGRFGDASSFMDDAWAARALSLLGRDDLAAPVRQALIAIQNDDGGWGYTYGQASGPDTTAWALWATGNVGNATVYVSSLLETIEATGLVDGPGVGPNCQSTAWALDAARTLDLDPDFDVLDACRDGNGFRHHPDGERDGWATMDLLHVLWRP